MTNHAGEKKIVSRPERLKPERIKKDIECLGENLSKLSGEDLVKYADDLGFYLSPRNQNRESRYEEPLSTGQIRKFLDAVNRLDNLRQKEGFAKIEEGVILLKPQIAYAVGRQRNSVKPLQKVLDPCLGKIKTEEDFKKLVRFVEAIVAYHKYYGGE